jgi:hypothetical protein
MLAQSNDELRTLGDFSISQFRSELALLSVLTTPVPVSGAEEPKNQAMWSN